MNLRILLPLMFLAFVGKGYAQSTTTTTTATTATTTTATPKSQERDVKVSGNYYYGDGTSYSQEEATKLALMDLKMMISEDLKTTNQEISSVTFDGFEQSIGTITIPIQDRVRVIAFVLKTEIKIKPNGEKRLMVIRIYPDESTANEVNTSGESVIKPTTIKPASVEPTTITSTTITSTPIDVDSNKSSSESNRVDNTYPEIISEIMKITRSKDVGAYMDKKKSQGKLIYGKLRTMNDAPKCYFVIFRDGKLVDVLDVGSGTIRKGLISGDRVNYTRVRDIIYWVYVC